MIIIFIINFRQRCFILLHAAKFESILKGSVCIYDTLDLGILVGVGGLVKWGPGQIKDTSAIEFNNPLNPK